MEFVQLTAAQRQEFEENGYFIMRSVLDDEMIDRLLEAGDRFNGIIGPQWRTLWTQTRRIGTRARLRRTHIADKSDTFGNSTYWHQYPHHQYRAPLQAPTATRTSRAPWMAPRCRSTFGSRTQGLPTRWIKSGLLLNGL